MRNTQRFRLFSLSLLIFVTCSPPAIFLEPVSPSMNGVVAPPYRDMDEREVESIFVRPYTDRPLLETSGTTAAMLYDLAYLEKRVGSKSGGDQALYAMNSRYIEEGISFRIIVWGEVSRDVDLSRWRFRLRTDDDRFHDPIRVDPIGSPEYAEESLVDRDAIWYALAEATFPVRLARPLGSVVLEISKDGERVQHHTWKFDWDHAK